MRGDFDQFVEDILLAKVCNMNFLRLTQRPVQSEIYEYCEMLGLMLQTDLPFFGVVRRNMVCEAVRQAGQHHGHLHQRALRQCWRKARAPVAASWKILEDKYQRDNWCDDGYYRVGPHEAAAKTPYQDWQVGWVGGGMVPFQRQ